MKTKILQIHYPSVTTEKIGNITAIIRDNLLKELKSSRISYSFSSQKNSGYILVYPTAPVLSIRISNHTSKGYKPDESVLVEKINSTTINAEAEHGQLIAEGALAEAIRDAEELSKKVIKQFYAE